MVGSAEKKEKNFFLQYYVFQNLSLLTSFQQPTFARRYEFLAEVRWRNRENLAELLWREGSLWRRIFNTDDYYYLRLNYFIFGLLAFLFFVAEKYNEDVEYWNM